MDNKDIVLQACLNHPEKIPGRNWVARETGLAPATVGRWLSILRDEGALEGRSPGNANNERKTLEIEHPLLPDDLPSASELIERRKKEFKRKSVAKEARKLIPVKVNILGPIGILHMGDPHVDDSGTDIEALERHVQLIHDTEGLYGANVGDMQNNWIGRLSGLYGKQETTAAQAWVLVEWLVESVQWIYLVGGNHDFWHTNNSQKSPGDPLEWMIQQGRGGLYEPNGARIGLQFPNGKEVRINARHDFKGHSQWNPVHGVSKAAQMGWRDHILTCGHLHISGYTFTKCPSTGLISHAMRVAGYKIYDDYASEKGLPNQNISPAFMTVIDPTKADDDPDLVTTFFSPEKGADYLTWLRSN